MLDIFDCGVFAIDDGVRRLAAFVHGDKNKLVALGRAVESANVDENVLVGVEKLFLSSLESWVGAADGEEGLQGREGLLLFGGSGRCSEGVVRGGAKAAGEVVAVVGIFTAAHGDLVAGVDLGHATHSRKDGEGEFEGVRSDGWAVEKAGSVMVAEEGDEAFRMWVQIVEAKDVGELGHRCVFEQDVAKGKVGREVEGRIEAGVHTGAGDTAGKGRSDGCIAVEDFSDGREVGIERVKLSVEARPERTAHVGEGVDAETVEAGLFGPPDGVLDEITGDCGVFLVEIGERVGEPAFGDVALIAPRSMGIGERSEVSLGYGVVLEGAVKPGGVGAVADPGMGGADVVGDGVEDELHVAGVESRSEAFKVVEGAEVFVDGVHVGGAVAVITLVAVVLIDGGNPDRGDAELLQVVQMRRSPPCQPRCFASSAAWSGPSLVGSPSEKRSIMMRYMTSLEENPAKLSEGLRRGAKV
jgi:hypothetical protein